MMWLSTFLLVLKVAVNISIIAVILAMYPLLGTLIIMGVVLDLGIRILDGEIEL